MPSTLDAASLLKSNFIELGKSGALLGCDDPDQSESDTRSKLIDPIFTKCLRWPEREIRREEPVTPGYADYTFGLSFRWFHVEAKRALPRFRLYAPSRDRRLKLTGPHLLGNPAMRPLIDQAAKYSLDLGTEYSILTNGSQFVIFQSFARGRSWREGHAIIWHDHTDIESHFAEFWALLDKHNVEKGSLSAAFSPISSVTKPTFTPIQYVHNAESELIRNPFWSKISRAFSPILIDQPENENLQKEIIQNCYVSSPLAGESRDELSNLLRDLMPQFLIDADVKDLTLANRGMGSFRHKVVDDLKTGKPGTYVLTGGVGSGKTSFLRRFALVDKHDFISNYCVWLHVDFLEFGSESEVDIAQRIRKYTFTRILDQLHASYPHHVPRSGEELRSVFEEELSQLHLTKLFGIDKESDEYRKIVNERVDFLFQNTDIFLSAVLRSIRKAGKCVVFVLDNTDQLGELFQREVFLFSQELSDRYSTLSIVSLREDKFFAAYRLGVFDAYGTRKFHIGSPELLDVISKRLNYGLKRYRDMAEVERIPHAERVEVADVITTLINASTTKNSNIMRFLQSVSAGDMRLALRMFNDFMSSGNTDTRKIQRIVRREGAGSYSMPFHEFAKSAILGSRRYYKGSVAQVTNVFAPSAAPGASHWTASRILARLLANSKSYSRFGEGFIESESLVAEYQASFGNKDDFFRTVERLILAGLIESEPPKEARMEKVVALRISATGAYYWSYLMRSFAYLDCVFVDTPLHNESLAQELAREAERSKDSEGMRPKQWIQMRVARVRKFLQYLAQVDADEMKLAAQQGGPYTEALSTQVAAQVEQEMQGILNRNRIS